MPTLTPHEMLARGVFGADGADSAIMVQKLTSSPRRLTAGSADNAPAHRRGQDDNLAHPSRVGERLHWRDGRVTGLAGRARAKGGET